MELTWMEDDSPPPGPCQTRCGFHHDRERGWGRQRGSHGAV